MAQIQIENLTYYYPEKTKPALEKINLEILEGQFVLIVGGSGCGKSTLVRALTGLVPEFYGGTFGGKVSLNGQEIQRLDKRKLAQQIGMVFQDPESQLVMTNVEEELAFGLENLGLPNDLMKRRVMEVTGALGLSNYLQQFIPELSGGQKQKVALGAILAMQPDILVLDEPTSQLDPVAGEEILTMLKRLNEENGLTVVLVEQRLERCFHLADRVIVMNKGRIAFDGEPEQAAKWAALNHSPFIPPLANLFAGAGFQDVPLTVKKGREILKRHFAITQCASPVQQKNIKVVPVQKDSIVSVENLWFAYPTGKEVLKKINLQIRPGDFTVIMGENAAGKTTLLRNINGLLRPSRGQVKILNQDIKKMTVEELAKDIGYLSQNPNDYLFLPTVKEELNYTLHNLNLPDNGICEKLLERLHLMDHLQTNPRDLSSGERQRVALATVLVAKPKLLLLDEPTRGLDYQLKEELGKILWKLQSQGMAILMITHDVEFAAEYATDIILMAEGSFVAQGSKYDILTDSTFYSPQISKLFHNIVEKVVTLKQGEKILNKMSTILNQQQFTVTGNNVK
ncbi:energy-coupling factor transporter ATPase [Bacillota bacterium LX-D]|nr:energy-coupling factor transporter ATPase [Bacillota bacterium LX-D]